MENKPVNFNFFNEITDYTDSLGKLCPDKYTHIPEAGDTVEIDVNFMGIKINKGTVIKQAKSNKKLTSIMKKIEEYESLEDDDNDYLQKDFDFTAEEPNENARSVIIKFSEKLTTKFINSNIGPDVNVDIEPELIFKKIKAKISGNKQDGYFLTGHLKAFIDGLSVISTKSLDGFKKLHAKATNVENVAWSDRILPAALLTDLNNSLDEMCEKETADYHPGSGKVVRDIVHPSLFCYVRGVSKVNSTSCDPQGENAGKDFWGREYEGSTYQWLPAEFLVSNDGTVKINSYINNLDRNKYKNLYTIIERMFERTLPMFEAVCGSLRNDFYGISENKNEPKSISLRNRSLQVVTKIVEYRVNREENFDGVWHVEGMSHEEVLATALCVVKRDENFSGAEIEFRRFLFADEGDKLIESTPQNAHRPTDTMGGGDVRPLGCLKTPAKRVVVFPNSHIHRLSSMRSSDGKDATRRIIVFWLVNPERPIISTRDVPPQQETMSLDEALRYRLALMSERKLHKESYEEREVFLCEH